jgi:hypothetical protein
LMFHLRTPMRHDGTGRAGLGVPSPSTRKNLARLDLRAAAKFGATKQPK